MIPRNAVVPAALGVSAGSPCSLIMNEIDVPAVWLWVGSPLAFLSSSLERETTTMSNQRRTSDQNTSVIHEDIADYFGLTVILVARMDNCSLIRYGHTESIIETEDLQKCLMVERAAA